jgi:hypothetical protein
MGARLGTVAKYRKVSQRRQLWMHSSKARGGQEISKGRARKGISEDQSQRNQAQRQTPSSHRRQSIRKSPANHM